MSYYGYTPKVADMSGIERAGQTIGGTIAGLPEKIEAKKAREDADAARKAAVEAAQEATAKFLLRPNAVDPISNENIGNNQLFISKNQINLWKN